MTGASSRIAKAIEALSGRIDFLKQSLTIALAGVAGVAVLFTDPDKVPKSLTGIIAICVAALALLAAAAIAYMGLSAYANALLTLEKGQNPAHYRTSILGHAQGVFVALAIAAVAITVFAGSQIGARDEPKELAANPSQALDLAWGTLARRGLDVQLQRFGREGEDYVGRFTLRTAMRVSVEGTAKVSDPEQPEPGVSRTVYVVRIDGKTGKLRGISREVEKSDRAPPPASSPRT